MAYKILQNLSLSLILSYSPSPSLTMFHHSGPTLAFGKDPEWRPSVLRLFISSLPCLLAGGLARILPTFSLGNWMDQELLLGFSARWGRWACTYFVLNWNSVQASPGEQVIIFKARKEHNPVWNKCLPSWSATYMSLSTGWKLLSGATWSLHDFNPMSKDLEPTWRVFSI